MRVFAKVPFRYPAQTGKDYPYGYFDVPDDSLARTLIAGGFVVDATVPPGNSVAAGAGTGQALTLLAGATSTGAAFDWLGGKGTFTATCSNWNTANVSLQYSFDGGTTWLAAGAYCAFSANGSGNFSLAPCKLRAAISGATPGAGVTATAVSSGS